MDKSEKEPSTPTRVRSSMLSADPNIRQFADASSQEEKAKWLIIYKFHYNTVLYAPYTKRESISLPPIYPIQSDIARLCPMCEGVQATCPLCLLVGEAIGIVVVMTGITMLQPGSDTVKSITDLIYGEWSKRQNTHKRKFEHGLDTDNNDPALTKKKLSN